MTTTNITTSSPSCQHQQNLTTTAKIATTNTQIQQKSYPKLPPLLPVAPPPSPPQANSPPSPPPHHQYEATRKSPQSRSNQAGDDLTVSENHGSMKPPQVVVS
ncbi:protein SCAR-like [Olea europaea var. sylvestris]|uniref:protein SCAR-like n=1 Tax=Olea europaea var. sylvestris TaxID=158386 RepID=UPI000C1D8680|nr:protein SCAR-like [Olea europaea var. sylvestris]